MTGEYEPGGPGWWIASDGLWYPPESRPAPPPPPGAAATTTVASRLYRPVATGTVALMAAAFVSGLADHLVSEDASEWLGIGSWVVFWIAAWQVWPHARRRAGWLPLWAWATVAFVVAFGLTSADTDPVAADDGSPIVVNARSDGEGDGEMQPVVALPTTTGASPALAQVPPTAVPPPPTSTPTPTSVPPTSVPPTAVPPTAVPPTAVPPTAVPPTAVPPTAVPPTAVPPTAVPPTSVPPTSVPPTSVPPPTAVPPPPTSIPQPAPPARDCHPSYTPCVPNSATDLNCPDIGFMVRVIGPDVYGFDGNDNDGLGCESYG